MGGVRVGGGGEELGGCHNSSVDKQKEIASKTGAAAEHHDPSMQPRTLS